MFAHHKLNRAFLVGIFVCVLMLGAVSISSAQDTVELTVWTEWTAGGESDSFNALVDQWNSEHPGIHVTHRPIGNDEFFTVIRTGMAGSEPPDILQYEGYQQTRDFAAAGQLIPVTDLWDEIKDGFLLQDAGIAACSYEGEMYCIPTHFASAWQMFYNPDLLNEFGVEVPTTYEEFLAAADVFKDAGIAPIAMGDSAGWPAEHYWMAYLVQNCGVEKVYDALALDGSASFTDECFVKSAADLQYLAQNGYFTAGMASDDFDVAQALFVSGVTPFFHTGTWLLGDFPDDAGFQLSMFPFPRFEDAAVNNEIIGAVTITFGIASGSKHQEEAMEFLRFVTSQEAGDVFAHYDVLSLRAGSVATYSSDLAKEAWHGIETAENALPWIENEMPAAVGENQIYRGTVQLLTGQLTPEEFCANLQAALEEAAAS